MNGVPVSRSLTASVKRVASTEELLYYLEEQEASRGAELALGFSDEFDAWVRETYEEGETDEDSLDEIIAGEDSRNLMLDLPDWVWEEWYESRAWEPALRADLAYAPSWYLMSDPEPFTGLAVHFTNAPEKVASEGFRYGVRDESRLGLTRHLDDYDDRPGYNFAYALKDWKKYARKSDGTYRYGQGAVVFPVKGVSVWHAGDKERQVIFWGPDVRSGITPVVKTKGGWESRGQVYGDLESALDGFRFSQRLSAKSTSMSASVKRVASRYKEASEELPFDRFYKSLDAKTAGMKTPLDLPEGWYVEISGSLSSVRIYLLDDRDKTVGSLGLHRTGDFLQVNEIQARQGWGPLLYDLALEVANEFDDEGLMPDRSMVSREAQAVWDHYLTRRSDVEATPLPDSVLELGGAGHVRTRLDRYESGSPLSYSYRKTTGNPFMRQLASLGRLESDDYFFDLPVVRSASRHRMVLVLDSHEVKAPRGWVHIEEVEIIPDPKGMFDPTGQDHEILTVDWVMDPDGPDEATHIGMPLRDFLRLTGLSGRVVSGIVADAYEDQASEYEDRLSYRG